MTKDEKRILKNINKDRLKYHNACDISDIEDAGRTCASLKDKGLIEYGFKCAGGGLYIKITEDGIRSLSIDYKWFLTGLVFPALLFFFDKGCDNTSTVVNNNTVIEHQSNFLEKLNNVVNYETNKLEKVNADTLEAEKYMFILIKHM